VAALSGSEAHRQIGTSHDVQPVKRQVVLNLRHCHLLVCRYEDTIPHIGTSLSRAAGTRDEVLV
jgi:hypothetical protein